MSSDVLFLIHDIYQDDNQLPLGIAYLASILENNGYSVEIYCMDVFHYSNKDLKEKLENNEYKLIGVNFLAARFKETVIELCKVINEYKKDAWLVLGGHGPSPIPEYILNKTKCDVIAVGEAEESILRIIDDYKSKSNKKIYYSTPIKDLDTIPSPAWHLFPIDRYADSIKFPRMKRDDRILQMISSRGCINTCSFCMRLEKGMRLRSIDKVVDEIQYLHDTYGINTIQFQDEMFLISKKRLIEFKNKLKKQRLDIKFSMDARVDIFDREIANILKEIGCIMLNFGFESSTQEVLDYMKKHTTVEKNIDALEISKEFQLTVGLNFIWGYPPDNLETLKKNAYYIKKYNHYHQLRTIRPVTAYPGCELYYEAIDKGLLTGPDDFFNKFENSDLITVNFTKYQNDVCYKWLYDVNKDLIEDHYTHTNGDKKDMTYLIEQLGELYSGKLNNFRGFRHYAPNK